MRLVLAILLASILTAAMAATAQEVPLPQADNDATNSLPPTPISEGRPCQVRDNSELSAWIDRLHSSLYRITCSSATWFDGLFGSGRYDQEYRATHGTVSMGGLWSQRDGIDKVLRFHARMYFPQISERFHAFIGRVNQEDFVSESKGDIYGLPNAFGSSIENSTLLGLGYSEPLKKRGSFDADAGVHLQFPLDPYVKASYRYARPLGDRDLVRLRETFFWENIQGLGETTRADWDHVISDRYFLRWANAGTFSESTEGLSWSSALTLYHVISLSKQSAFAYEAAINGSSDSGVPLSNYGVTVTYRQSVWRTWLIMELRTGVDWPQYVSDEPRRSNFSGGIAFHMAYGRP